MTMHTCAHTHTHLRFPYIDGLCDYSTSPERHKSKTGHKKKPLAGPAATAYYQICHGFGPFAKV